MSLREAEEKFYEGMLQQGPQYGMVPKTTPEPRKPVAVEGRLVLRRCPAKSRTPGGIIIPDAAKDAPQECEVISSSDGWRVLHGRDVTVMIGKYSGTTGEVDGIEYVFVDEKDVLCVLPARGES